MEQAIIAIPAELFATAESSSFEGMYDLRELDAGPDSYAFAEPLRYSVDVTNTGGALLVSGSVRGRGRTRCVRCLEDVFVDVEGDVQGYFVIDRSHEPDEDLEGDEFEYLDGRDRIDLRPLIEAAVLVDLPILPLCRQDCAGICQDCGANLNEESCDCAAKRRAAAEADHEQDNPFAVLSRLSFDEDEGALDESVPDAPGADEDL